MLIYKVLLPRPRRGLRFHPVCLSVCLCVCVCACVRACVRACVHVCVRPIFWYFISQVLEEISIWNLYRILIGLYSIHWTIIDLHMSKVKVTGTVQWFYVVQSMYYLKDNTWTLHDIIKYHVLLQPGHTDTHIHIHIHTHTYTHTHTHTQTNKVNTITLLCKIKNSSEQWNYVTKKYHFFSILMGWTLPSTGMWRGEVFAIFDCLVFICEQNGTAKVL